MMYRFAISLRVIFTVVFITALIMVFYVDSLGAMDWPSQEAVMVRNFGWNDRGKPVLGTVFEGEGPVLAAETGEVIFSRRKDDIASRLPSPLGAWTALDHGDGLISIYSRYEDSGVIRRSGVERQSPIASAGTSGWSSRKGFYFILYDRRERRWINPSMIITPFHDTRPPQILTVDLRNAQGALIPRGQTRMGQGRHTILVAVSDTMLDARESPLAPHRIVCSVNGAEIGSLNFETISARDGVLMVYRNGLAPVKQVYAPFPAFEAGEVFLTRGQASLEIIVQDIAGNSRGTITRMIVE
ncbi:hypothetical protein AGMMS50293_17230 [Spirochaetia bacterium]|nr:hypothetical protein AGMMS50293_17230 [Spirochaetia bacterium]